MKHLYFQKNAFALLCLLLALNSIAQPGCPSISAGSNVTLPCGTTCTNLTATYFQAGNTTTYTVSQIPYTPFSYTGGTSVLVNQDDIWSCPISLPFTFCYFGQSYNQFVIGANAVVSFTPKGTCVPPLFYPSCTWPINAAIPSALPTDMQNTIMAPWHDIDPSVGSGTIKYQVIGTAPCRILVVSWYNIPMFSSSCNNLIATSQVALYETTNVIEMYIANKPSCPTWNSGYAIQGIQNQNGTVAYTVPGRNYPTVWTAQNDARRFTPSGPSIVSVQWLQGGTQISNTATVQVCPTAPTTYTAQATYTPCTGGTPVVVSSNVTVSPGGSLNASIASSQNVTCFGGNNGSATASVSGGVAPVNYGWSTGSSNLTINNLTQGTYTFTASDGTGCTTTNSVTITQPTQITFNAPTIQNIGCDPSVLGSITANPTGGNPPYTYSWTKQPGGQTYTGQTISNLQAATYNVTVTDNSNCTGTATYSVTQVQQLNFSLSSTNVSCNGGNNGTATATVSSGTPPYQYNWNNTGNVPNNTATGLSAGTTTVTVSDANCTASATISLSQPAALQLNPPVIQNISCGTGTGSITASATGGTGTLTYSWTKLSNGQTYSGASISNLTADTYNLTVTDNNNCTVTASYQVTQNAGVAFTQSSTNVTCFGANDGTATITITGGTPPYQYNWNGTGNTPNASLSNLGAGTVNVTITDANCSATATFTITEPPALTVALQNQTNVTCFGGNNGSLTVSASGGSGTFSYQWSNGATGSTASNLTANTYTVIVNDGACTVSDSYTITQAAQLVLNQPNIQHVGCTGATTGSITANASGGTPGYTYNWVQQSNGQTYTGQTITNLNGDTYNLTVTDNSGCTVSNNYQLIQVTPLSFSTSFSNVSCNGGNDGAAIVTVNTGTAPYQYNWNGSGNSPNSSLTGLSAGIVNVTVTDVNCSGTATFTITEPTALVINLINQTNVSCSGANDGSLTVAASGGTPGAAGTGYTYAWSNGQTGASATNLGANSYTVVVADGNSCTASQTYTIVQATPLTVSITGTDATCYQGANGSANAVATGGVTPYDYLWNDGQTTAAAVALTGGTYSCIVSDVNGCTASSSILINEPPDLVINTQTTAVLCAGDENGTITVFAVGGTSPYSYSATLDFANFVFATNGIIQDLAPGSYSVIVSDNNGCTKTVVAVVPDAATDAFTITTDSTSCYGPNFNDGAIHVVPTTALNAPFQYSVDGGFQQFSGDFYFLSAGTHSITVTNANGCITTLQAVVHQPLPIIAQVTPDSLILALGASGQVLVTYQNASNVNYNWNPPTGLSCSDCANPTVLVYGRNNYTVTVSSQANAACYATATLLVDVLPELPIYIPNTFTPNGDGNNDVFQIYGQGIKTIDLKIFNRWGELVYKSNNQFDGWDGTYKNQLQLPQVFTYHAEIIFLNNKKIEKAGSVTLVR
ncbi:MAG: gliding motility-associated C-terminal domain-containing protein [Chitinophagales bacterium]|nr:gliding motility-associated C-terminal domain-containing protein [Chitinophagales bacterium]